MALFNFLALDAANAQVVEVQVAYDDQDGTIKMPATPTGPDDLVNLATLAGAGAPGGGVGVVLPADAQGYLANDGNGNLAWGAITLSVGDVGGLTQALGQMVPKAGGQMDVDATISWQAGNTPKTFVLDGGDPAGASVARMTLDAANDVKMLQGITEAPNNPPAANSLLPGEIYIEAGSAPRRVWVGVTPNLDPSGRVDLTGAGSFIMLTPPAGTSQVIEGQDVGDTPLEVHGAIGQTAPVFRIAISNDELWRIEPDGSIRYTLAPGAANFGFWTDSTGTSIYRMRADGDATDPRDILRKATADALYAPVVSSPDKKKDQKAAFDPVEGWADVLPYRYTWDDETSPRHGRSGFGFLAPQVERVLPQAAITDADGNLRGLDPLTLIAAQQLEIRALNSRAVEQQQVASDMHNRIKSLEAMVESLQSLIERPGGRNRE